jgi:DNA-directed RNA polymerase subunit omega
MTAKKGDVKLDLCQTRCIVAGFPDLSISLHITRPMKQALVQDALKIVHSPQVLVNIISRRVRQLGQGFRPLIIVDPRSTFMDVALQEVAQGKLGFEMIEVPPVSPPVTHKKTRRASH